VDQYALLQLLKDVSLDMVNADYELAEAGCVVGPGACYLPRPRKSSKFARVRNLKSTSTRIAIVISFMRHEINVEPTGASTLTDERELNVD